MLQPGRAWDIVVAAICRAMASAAGIEELLHTPPVVGVERVSDDHQECRLTGNWASRMRTRS